MSLALQGILKSRIERLNRENKRCKQCEKQERNIFLGFALPLAGLLTGCGTTIRKNSADGQRVFYGGGNDYTAINPALYEHGDQCAAVRGADGA